MAVIEISNLNKSYNKKQVLKDINILIEENKIYGLLGRNGAGKTTLLNLITDRVCCDSGQITIDDENVYENDKALGKVYFMTERNLYPEDYKVEDIFKWTKEFYENFDINYAYTVSKKFGLDVNKRIKSLSTGYGSICKIIITLASNAEVLIFDEPVLGLDANHRELFYKVLIENYIEDPKTIILSTHIIEEVSSILEKVIIINNGSIITTNEAEALLNNAYTVSGLSENIEEYIKAKEIVNIEEIASFKAVTVIGDISKEDKEVAERLELKFSKVELQKLFIYLTEKEEG